VATPHNSPSAAPEATDSPAATDDTSEDVMSLGHFSALQPGSYFIDPDGDPSTSLRVIFEVAAGGWESWIGAAKFSDAGHVGVSITTVTNVVTDGCENHGWADPPVGPSVDDLATALAELEPFELTSAPADVSAYGYSGKHLAWEVPADVPFANGTFTSCEGSQLMSWVAFIDTSDRDAFYGYAKPGYVEEFWILDVAGTRLMIAAEQSPNSPAEDSSEQEAILASIRIEP
jgi:hypothetical protein